MRIPEFLKRRVLLYVVAGLAATFVAIKLFATPLFTFSNFYEERDDFGFHVRNKNDAMAGRHLRHLDRYYQWAQTYIPFPLLSGGFEWLADRFVFEDAGLYRAQHYYLIGDYNRVYSEIGDRSDQAAQRLMGAARFRGLQVEYLKAVEGKEGEELEGIRKEFVRRGRDEVGPFFERALMADPDGLFDHKWNYDLVTDPANMQKSLEGNKAPTMFILGLDNKPGSEDSVPRLDENSRPGNSDPQRKS